MASGAFGDAGRAEPTVALFEHVGVGVKRRAPYVRVSSETDSMSSTPSTFLRAQRTAGTAE